MKASWEKSEKNQGVLTVEVEADQVDAALDKAFKKVVHKVNVPGFRKGKVPRQIFEAKFGAESLYQDAIDILLPEAYMEALKETKVEPIDRPEIDVDEFAKGEAFKFTAKVLVKPEVKLGEYKGIEIPEKDISVSSEEIEEELKSMQQRHAELVVLEEGTAENGDTAVIDFEGFVDEVAFDGGKAENHSLELGSGNFIPGFEDQVIGMSKGEEKDVNVTFPEEYQSEDLAGKAAVFKVKLHEIKRKNLPELDDEFAKDVSEFETLEEYKQDIEKGLKAKKEQENERNRENTVVEKAAEAAEVEVPAPMVETEIEQMLQDFSNRLRQQGMNMESYYQFSGQDEAALKEQMRGDAEKRVLQNLVLEAIAKEENVTVTEEEINEELEKMGEMYQKSAEELRTILSANGNMDGLEKDLTTRKTVKLLIELSKTTTDVA
jgi:trigger factor